MENETEKRRAGMARLAAARNNPDHPLSVLTRIVSGSGGPFIVEQPAPHVIAGECK